MNKIFCSIDERFVNPLFEVFDGGDFILSSYRDIEESQTQVQIYYPDPAAPRTLEEETADAKQRLSDAMALVGVSAPLSYAVIPDEDWKLSYRRHFTTERIGARLVVRPPWEPEPAEGVVLTLDPGLAFGTGKHETTRACLGFVDALSASGGSFLDMGCGSGILSIAAAKLGYSPVAGFDVDQEAVDASVENAALNGAAAEFFRYGLGAAVRRELPCADLVAANILGPLLIRFADEIVPCVKRHLIISGILNELYPEVLAAYTARGLTEVSRTVIGEWTTGLLIRSDCPSS
jgi:ribosomal protein L11 methyltransferase